MRLWYKNPARRWEETLPIGNGSLGGMIFGDPHEEIIGINEESIWSGYYKDKNNYEAYDFLPQVRSLIFEKKYAKAEEIIRRHMLGEYNECYLPVGNLKIGQESCGKYEQYCRQLDLENATVKSSYRCGKVSYEREAFASYPARAIFYRLRASECIQELKISFESSLAAEIIARGQTLYITATCPEHVDPNYVETRPENWIQGERGMQFQGRVQILYCDGTVETDGNALRIKKAGEVILALTVVREGLFQGKTYQEIYREHLEDYRSIMELSSLYLGEEPDLPTDERLELIRNGQEDPALYALYYQYGRYLLISSSRKGSLPANLQGIWSWELRAPWSSNWTTNINTQMNYWPVHTCNLEACMEPFYSMMETLCREGKKTAAIHYGCRGFVHHHNADFWGNTNPVGKIWGASEGQKDSVVWSFWPMGGIWMCNEMYQAYEYTKDVELLRERIFPILREAVLFAVDWLIPWKGYYVTCPSTSPENRYRAKTGEVTCLTVASTMDLALIRQLFSDFQKACRKLGIQDELLEEVKEKERRLLPFRTGADGRLLEWLEEQEEVEPGHRHVSHLYGLYPGDCYLQDPGLVEAAKKSLEYRLAHGGGYTGWSCAWIINLWAVLGSGEKAYQYLEALLKKSTYKNLWDAHPPFQIDGNFGGIAGIAQMLLQSDPHTIRILPALPTRWKSGEVYGLRGKGDLTVAIRWGEETHVTIRTGHLPFEGMLEYGRDRKSITLEAYEEKTFVYAG